MEYNQLALVPRRNFSNVISTQIQEQIRQPQLPGWTPLFQPEASTSTLPKPPPIKTRRPREADRSRLAKDILKQLGKPSGFAPTVPTKYEYEERRKAEAGMEAASAQPPAQPVVAEPQLLSNHDEASSPPEIAPVPDQVARSDLHVDHHPATPVGEPPLLEYPDTGPNTTPDGAGATEQDVHMDAQPPEDSLAPQSPASSGPNPPKDSASLPVAPELAPEVEETSTPEHPLPSAPSLSKWSGPPPDAEIIEISDDEEVAVDTVTTTVEPMEVDEETGTGGPISQSLSELSLDREGAPVVVETEKDPPGEPLSRRSSQELTGSGGVQLKGRKFPRNQVSVELPPLPDYVRKNKGKERAPIQEEDEEGLYRVSAWRACFLIT